MKDYDAYLFDWDGTVAQTFAKWLSIVKETVVAYGIDVSDKQLVRELFCRARIGLLELGVPEWNLPGIFRSWDVRAQARMPQVPQFIEDRLTYIINSWQELIDQLQ